MDLRILSALAQDYPPGPVLRTVTLANPAAGADFTFTAPGESTWGLVSVSARLVTSAVVANRAPVFTVTDGANPQWRVPPVAVQAATATVDYSWLPELGPIGTAAVGGVSAVALPPVYLAPGFAFGPITTLIDVGDQWSRITAQVVELFTGEREHERAIADSVMEHAMSIANLLEGNI